jgi:hypothetical protein
VIPADAPVTPLRDLKPRRPIACSLCGRLLGAWWQYKTTMYPYFVSCSQRCETLIAFVGESKGVPRQWRDYPQEWRSPLLAAAMIERETDRERRKAVD